MEAALTCIQDCEDYIVAVCTEDKIQARGLVAFINSGFMERKGD